ncbi:MAG TPA: hypothetical protein DDZ88_16450 [Verrucomicrobiales bacterium]|nr:hypothetical protein [Verrucomicrobiales bacterium]
MKHLFRSFLVVATLAFTFVIPPVASQAADVSVTAANFKPGSGALFHTGICGATVTAGQLIAISPSTGKFVLADANDVSLCKVIGISAHAAIDTQPLAVVYHADDCTLGATLSMTAPVYVCSATAGGIAPAADLSAGGLYPVVGIIAKSTTKCIVRFPAITGSAVTVTE